VINDTIRTIKIEEILLGSTEIRTQTNLPDYGGNKTRDLSYTFTMLCQLKE
jgi:hypothetical protein